MAHAARETAGAAPDTPIGLAGGVALSGFAPVPSEVLPILLATLSMNRTFAKARVPDAKNAHEVLDTSCQKRSGVLFVVAFHAGF